MSCSFSCCISLSALPRSSTISGRTPPGGAPWGCEAHILTYPNCLNHLSWGRKAQVPKIRGRPSVGHCLPHLSGEVEDNSSKTLEIHLPPVLGPAQPVMSRSLDRHGSPHFVRLPRYLSQWPPEISRCRIISCAVEQARLVADITRQHSLGEPADGRFRRCWQGAEFLCIRPQDKRNILCRLSRISAGGRLSIELSPCANGEPVSR